MILRSLKKDATGLEYSNIPTNIKAYTYAGNAIERLRPQLKNLLPGLIEASDLIGSTQIQGRATMGGNLCNSSPAGDSIPAMIAVGAVCDIAGVSGSRELPVEDFVTGVGTNALSDGELLLGLKIAKVWIQYSLFLSKTSIWRRSIE